MWNLSIDRFGYVSSLQALSFVGAVVWAGVADRTGKPKFVMVTCSAGYALLMFGLALPLFKESQLAMTVWAASITGAAQFFLAGCFPVLDAVILGMLSNRSARDGVTDRELFGRQRLWGTFGHLASTYLSMVSIRLLGWSGMYWLNAICAGAFILVLIAGVPNNLPWRLRKREGRSFSQPPGKRLNNAISSIPLQAQRPVSLTSPSKQLLSSPSFLFFLLIMSVAGQIRAVLSNFGSYFLEQVQGKSKRFIADAGAVRVITEVAVFWWGKSLMNLLGPYWMLIVSQLAGIARVLGYGLIPNPPNKNLDVSLMDNRFRWIVYGLELLKGINTGMIVSAGVRLATDTAPQSRECIASAQGWFSGIYTGLSTAMAGIIGGGLIGKFESQGHPEPMQKMFRVFAYMAMFMLALFIVKYALFDHVIITGYSEERSRRRDLRQIIRSEERSRSRSVDMEQGVTTVNGISKLDQELASQ